VGKSGLIENYFSTGTAFGDDTIMTGRPIPTIRVKSVKRDGRSGFGKTFAKEHLAVDATVDFMIDVFNTGTGQIVGVGMGDVVGEEVNLDVRGRGGQPGGRQREGQDQR